MKNTNISFGKAIYLFVALLITFQSNAQFASDNQVFDNIHDLKKYKEKTYAEGAATDKQFERWYWFVEPRIGPTGKMQKETFTTQQTLNAYLDEQEMTRNNSTHNGYWTFVGGNDYQLTGTSDHSGGVGRVNTIEFDPNHPNIFYVGTAAGGLWKTSNFGQDYNCLTNGMSAISVSAISVDPQNSNTIFMAIGDADGAATKFRDVGIVKTSDGGSTWYSTSLFWRDDSLKARIYQLITHPTNSSIMYAATSKGFYTTSDGWETVDTISTTASISMRDFFWDVKFKPGQPDSVYFCDGRRIYVYNANLQDIDTLFITQFFNYKRFRINLETMDNYPEYLYAIRGLKTKTGNPENGFQGFYLSTNAGQSFRTMSTSPNILGRDTIVGDSASQATYDLSITVNPLDPADVIIGGINIWTSADTGATWICNSYYRRKTMLNYIHADIHDLEYWNNEVFACTDGGVNRSSNDGVSWLEISGGLGINQVYDIAISKQNINNTYGGLQDNGLNRFKTDGTMDQVKAGDEMNLVINSNDDDTIVFFREKGRLYRSYDGGDSTRFINNWKTSTWVCPIIMDSDNPQNIHIGIDDSIMFSFNSFETPSILKLVIPGEKINEMAQGINNTDKMYVSTDLNIFKIDNVYSSFDTTIITKNIPLDSAKITGIAIDPNNWQRAWICFSGFVDGLKVYWTGDGGGHWTDISDNLPNVPVNCITYEPGSNDGIYIGTDIGVFYRDNNLNHWIYFTNGLPTTVVNDLEIHVSTGKIRAATYGRGVWESDLYLTCPEAKLLSQANDPSDPDFTGIQRYEASSSIISTRIITGGYGTDVVYHAGDVVILGPGFHARTANSFEAKTAPCGSQTRSQQVVVSGRLFME